MATDDKTEIHYPRVQTLSGELLNVHKVVQENAEKLENFTLPKHNVVQPVVYNDLTSDFGHFSQTEVNKMATADLLMVAVVNRLLKQSLKYRNYGECLSIIRNSGMTMTDHSDTKTRSETLIRTSVQLGEFNAPDAIITDVKKWILKVLGDTEVYEALEFDKHVKKIANLYYQTSDLNAWDVLTDSNRAEATLIDISVLRYPDADAPYFYIYNVNLKLWNQTSFDLIKDKQRDEQNGLELTFKYTKLSAYRDILLKLDNQNSIKNEALDFYKSA